MNYHHVKQVCRGFSFGRTEHISSPMLVVAMSRRLRGQTTLQNLIGRNTIAKKATSAQRAVRSVETQLPESSAQRPVLHDSKPVKDDASTVPADTSHVEVSPDHVACPICGLLLGSDLYQMNLHLGKIFASHTCL